MLKLEKNERIQVWEVQAIVATKKQDHPFVSVLMAAAEIEDEGNVVTAAAIRDRLFQSLPPRGLENLLRRLCISGLFVEEMAGEFGLTVLGRECAKDRSIWIEEQGVYQIGFANSPFIPQEIIFIKEVANGNLKVEEDDIVPRPAWLKEFIGPILEFPNASKQILDIEGRCVQKDDLSLKMTIECQEEFSQLEIKPAGYSLLIPDLSMSIARSTILKNDRSIAYDEALDLVKVAYDAEDLSFKRNVKIGKPRLKEQEFGPLTLENIEFIPATEDDANRWYSNLVVKGINRYFQNDKEFEGYQMTIQAKFLPHFAPKVHPRAAFAKPMANRKDLFYHQAKLETINYLNY